MRLPLLHTTDALHSATQAISSRGDPHRQGNFKSGWDDLRGVWCGDRREPLVFSRTCGSDSTRDTAQTHLVMCLYMDASFYVDSSSVQCPVVGWGRRRRRPVIN